MVNMDNNQAKQRILDVAAQMFSQKGFAATRIDKIALQAKVNKALIYYYFPSKEAILDSLIESFFGEWLNAEMSYMQATHLKFMEEGRITLAQNRIHFSSEYDMDQYLNATKDYVETLLRWFISQRQILRIILSESLSDGKHEGELFRYFDAIMNKKSESFAEKDPNAMPKADIYFNKFFFGMMPLINFAVYSEGYAKISEQSIDGLIDFFLKNIMGQMVSAEDGKTLIFRTDSLL